MKLLNRKMIPRARRPIKVLQFGSGNFLRGFIDWQIQQLNDLSDFDAGVVCMKRSANPKVGDINKQDGLYHTVISGIDEEGEAHHTIQLIDCVQNEIDMSADYQGFCDIAKSAELEWVFSNMTEAGIGYDASDQLSDKPPNSFPAKLTQFLYERFIAFNGAIDKGLTIIPCELIDHNGEALKDIVFKYIKEWQLADEFKVWVAEANIFCSTLVDRIVPGFPFDKKDKLWQEIGYQDDFLVMAEYFYLFVIEGPESLKARLKLDRVPLNIIITDDITPYRQRKVAILNGAHTGLMPLAYLANQETVREALQNEILSFFLAGLLRDEVIPSLNMPNDELQLFAGEVMRRFRNPHIRHLWSSIALNSMAKFKARNFPALLNNLQKNCGSPAYLSFSLAALLAFYRGVKDDGIVYELNDEPYWLDYFQKEWQAVANHEQTIGELVVRILSDHDHWGIDLSQYTIFVCTVTSYLSDIVSLGMDTALEKFMVSARD